VKEETARAAANAIVLSAGVAAAYLILRKPRVRRLAWRAFRLWLGASVPAYLAGEVRQAWRESKEPIPVVHRPM
jgi:hypothetical protein